MRNRIAIVAAAVTVGILVTGIAWAAQDSGSTVNVSLAENQTVALPAEDAGVVVLSRAGGQLQIVSASPNTGYSVEVEVATGREVEADFHGNGERVQFNAELEDGVVRVRIRVEAASGVTSSTALTSDTGQTSSTGSTSLSSPTSTTAAAGSGTLVLANGQTSAVTVADAGSVLLRRDGESLTIVSTQANPGWVVEVEVGIGREVEGDFRNAGRRVKFNFELEDGVVRIRIESEGSTGTSVTNTTGTTITTATSPTSTTSSTSSTSTTVTSTSSGGSGLPTGTFTYNLDGAGTVTVVFANGQISIGSINPAAGWVVEDSEQKGDEVEVELTNGDSEARLRVRVNNGQLEVEIENKS
jgi:hypothetical protein